jgi:ribonuclease E
MGNKMLIDASQSEETRVVVARGSRIEEFDFESAAKKPLKGNIYLAKVTRVEPSLQAAFVEYGGNRHGFLAFAEIHPDYYQIPIADRLALLKEQEEEDAEHDDDDDEDEAPRHQATENIDAESHAEDAHYEETQQEPDEGDVDQHDLGDVMALDGAQMESVASEESAPSVDTNGETPDAANGEIVAIEEDAESQKIESIGAEDALEEVPRRRERKQPRRRYKIQEVIKRRQILLVQVVKEERGNKGAALTTYLSLAGRYCVLMPNTARGGGISRKITDAGDRRRLKEVARDVEVPQGMGLIVRTAGAQRTRPEIKRDFDYLMRLWESVRDLTLQSQAPCLVYEEGSLVKRSIRDLYTKDVDEVIVEGEEAYREAKDFMKMLMPSHAKNVKLYTENKPLFTKHGVENHLDALFSPTVNLPSGGYIVINQTEALVSIDINSGKATREHNIEDTAHKTNLEASDEIARQLRLRDLAGLVVIDYIDMEENRNNRNVERRLKEALKNDRARIQVGRISHFGLLEMSRQRLRPGLLEGTFRTCPHCEGRGMVRSTSSCVLGILRAIEDQLIKRPENLTVTCARDAAFYLLNEKRDSLLMLEQTYGVTIFVVPSLMDMKGTQHSIERAHDRILPPRRVVAAAPVRMEQAFEEEPITEEIEQADAAAEDETAEFEGAEQGERNGESESQDGARKRKRRRGRRGGRRDERPQQNGEEGVATEASEGDEQPSDAPAEFDADAAPNEDGEAAPAREADGDRPRKGRRDRFGRGRGRDRDRGPRPERSVEAPVGESETVSVEPVAAEAFEGDLQTERPERAPREDRPRRDRNERGGRGPRGGDRAERGDRGPRHDRGAPELVAPPPSVKIIIPDVIAEPEPRKWEPPAPTVQAEAVPKKGGWWSKK